MRKAKLLAAFLSLSLMLASCSQAPAEQDNYSLTEESLNLNKESLKKAVQAVLDADEQYKDEILGTEDSDNVIIRNTTDEIQFDWDEAMNNIYINGKKTQYPKTVASMGKGFSLGALAFQNKSGNEYMGYDTVTASVMHKDARIASAIIKGTVSTFDAKDPVLIWAVTSGNDNCELQGIYKFRLGDSVTVEELVEFFGTPTLRSEYKVVYEYEAPALKYIEFVISQKTGKLEGLIVGNRDEESKNKTSDEKTSDKKSLDEKSSDKKASEEKVPDNVIIRDTPGELQFDIDEAMKNIYIQGKKVPFPDTVANMGKGFSLDSNASDVRNDIEYYGFDEVITDVLYEGKVIGEAILKASAADLDANDPILYLSLMKSDDMDKWQGIYKFRLGDDISKEDIKEFFGEPTVDGSGYLLYGNVEEKRIRFNFYSEKGYMDAVKIGIN